MTATEKERIIKQEVSHANSYQRCIKLQKQNPTVATPSTSLTHDAPARCTPGSDAAAQLQPIPYACGAQRALLLIAVGAMNIDDLMNIINDVRESVTIFPRPCKLTFDLLTLKVVSESRVTWATCVPILVFLGLCSRVIPDVRDRQTTDVKQKHRLMPPPISGGA